MSIFYRVYCLRNFKETHFKWFWDKKMFLERMGFGGYELLGGVSGILAIQGGVFLINRFYGVLLNAANGVSQQVMNAVQQFTMNFFAAVSPQITKSLAAGEMEYFYQLVIRSSKFCFLLCFMFMAPLALQMDFALSIWLKIVPDYAGIFCQLSIIYMLLGISFGPLGHGITSTGKNKKFRIIDSFMTILTFPLTYIGLYFSPIGYICSHILMNVFRIVYLTFVLHKLTGFPIQRLINQSLLRSLAVGIISTPLPFYITLNMNDRQGFLMCLAAFFAMFIPSALFIGLKKNEREMVAKWVMEKSRCKTKW
jgi:O-antigen/teichoic acid export membrane protein